MEDTEVIRLRLGCVEEMFETPAWDGGIPPQQFEPGIDVCISELRNRRPRGPVRLELELPASRVDAGTSARLRQALDRYCAQRIERNDRDRRTTRRDGYAALKIGIPVALVGLAIAVATAVANTNDDYTLPNLAGWVLAWVGLWYPLDTILFSSMVPKRENGLLRVLREAEVAITPI